MNVVPTFARTKGQARRTGVGQHKKHVWGLETGHVNDMAVDASVETLFALIEEHEDYLKSLSEDGVYLGLHVNVRVRDSHLGFTIDRERLKLLARVGFLFDLDSCDP